MTKDVKGSSKKVTDLGSPWNVGDVTLGNPNGQTDIVHDEPNVVPRSDVKKAIDNKTK